MRALLSITLPLLIVACATRRVPASAPDADLRFLVRATDGEADSDLCTAAELWGVLDDEASWQRLEEAVKVTGTAEEQECLEVASLARRARLEREARFSPSLELAHPSAGVRAEALRWVASRKDARWVAQARGLLHDGSPEVRLAATEAAGGLEDREARARLKVLHEADPDPRVRSGAASALCALGESCSHEGMLLGALAGGQSPEALCESSNDAVRQALVGGQPQPVLEALLPFLDEAFDAAVGPGAPVSNVLQPRCELHADLRDRVLGSGLVAARGVVAAMLLWDRTGRTRP